MIKRTPEHDNNAYMIYVHVHIASRPGECLYVAERCEDTAQHGDFFLTPDFIKAAAFHIGGDQVHEAMRWLSFKTIEHGNTQYVPRSCNGIDYLNEKQRELLNL